MSNLSIFTLVCGIVGLVALGLFILGAILVILFAVKKRPDGRRPKGKLVIGIILMAVNVFVGFICLTFGVLGGVSNLTLSKVGVTETQEELKDVFENNDKKKIYKLLAEDGIKGDAVTEDDIDELYEVMGSDINDDLEVDVYGYNSNASYTNIQYVLGDFETEDGDRFYIYVDYVIEAKDEDEIGIQHIVLRDEDRKKVFEAGETLSSQEAR